MKIFINRIGNKISGAEMFNVYILQGLKEHKDLYISFSSDNNELLRIIKKIGYSTYYINPGIVEIGTKKQLLYSFFKFPKYYLNYLRLLIQVGNQDLYIFESMTEKLFLTPILTLFRRKVIWIEMGPLFQTQRATVIKWMYKFNSYFVGKIICVSDSTKQDLDFNGVGKNKTSTLYLGLDSEHFMQMDSKQIFRIKSKLGIQNKIVIGFLGEINKEKGIGDFIEVAALITKERKDIVFLVIGDGPLRKQIIEEVQERNLSSRFYFTGRVDDVKEYLGILNVLLFPSHHFEGLSITLLETIAMGVPCVASNIGGNSEIIKNGISGIVYKNSSPLKIKNAIYDVLANNKEYKKNTKDWALQKFSLKNSSKEFYSFFSNL